MGRPRKIRLEEEVTPIVEEIKKEVVGKSNDSYTVYSDSGVVRVYRTDVHGADAKKLAEEFANKNNYKIS